MRSEQVRWKRAVVVLLVGLATACSHPASVPPPGGPASAGVPTGNHAVPAVILGDSLSVQATEQYRQKIPGVVVDAVVGRTIVTPNLTDEGLSRVPELKTVDAAWFVIELGTNDSTFAGYPTTQSEADVAAMLDAVGRDRCVAWVLPFATDPRTPTQIASTEAFRQVVTQAVGSLSCNRILDWGALVQKNPHLIGTDGVHLTDIGIASFADLVAFGVS